jgi:hypothetical protein
MEIAQHVLSHKLTLYMGVAAYPVSVYDKSSVVLSTGYSDSLSETEVCNRSSVIRPLNTPRAPFVFQEVISQQLTAHPYSRIQSGNLEEEHYQTAVPVRSRPVVR